MKYLAMILLLTTQVCFSQTLEEFSLLTHDAKMELIENGHFDEVTDQNEITSTIDMNLLFKTVSFANDLVVVWGDTVLEGPYAIVEDDLNISVDTMYYKNGILYAIQGYVSNPAILIESTDCEFDYDTGEYNEQCYEGTISQYFYLDFNGVEIESDNYGDFDS
jgi:hypothetical protein